MPLINKLILSFSKKGFIIFIFAFWAFYYSIDLVFSGAYSTLSRAFFFYMLGAFIRLHLSERKLSAKDFAALIVIALIVLVIMGFAAFYSPRGLTKEALLELSMKDAFMNRGSLIITSCIGIPVFVFCLFRLVQNLKTGYSPVINAVASCTFGVYLLHDSPLSESLIWNKILCVSERQFPSEMFPLFGVLDIAGIFAVCCVLDLLRQKFIEKQYIKLFDNIFLKAKNRFIK